jgi:hypothetical protein
MTDDAEARLKAALHAYADMVDEPDTELPRPAPSGSARRTALQRWRGPAMVAAAVAVVTGGAWWAVGDRPDGDVVAGASEEAGTRSGSAADEASPAPESATGQAPDSDVATSLEAAGLPAAPEIGVPYALDLYTHCGVFGADVGGTWFAVDPPLVEGAGNPPSGWGNPYQAGVLTLTTADDAVFTDDLGHEIALRAAPDSARPAPCD